MNAKLSVFVICVEAIVYLLLYNLHDCTFKQFKLSFIIILGDFNTISNNWWPDNITSPEGNHINSLISMCDFYQIISELSPSNYIL